MHFSHEQKWALHTELCDIKGPSALPQMLGSHWENKGCGQKPRGTEQRSMKGVKKGARLLSSFQWTGEPRSGIILYSSSDILIYKLRMYWSPTAKIDLVVHLIQLMSEFESNYDSGADRQAITFLFSHSPAPSPSLSLSTPPPPRLFLLGRLCRQKTRE